MNVERAVVRLSRGRDTIRALASNVDDDQAHWKPAPDKWSIVEVINHLYDEERADFRLRIHILFERPEDPWPVVDPETWCSARHYNDRRLFESLETFTVERNKSLEWLSGLGSVDWNAGREHPRLGHLTAGDLLASWVAHDYLHVAQLARLHKSYHDHTSPPFSSRYAG
jgi:hypothetical protein